MSQGLAPIPPVTTPRLLLRPIEHPDLADLAEVNGDDEVTRFLPYASWTGPDDGEAWLQRMQALAETGTGQQLVIARRTDGRVIGSLLLFRHDAGSARLELGYVLGRAHWHQGLAREAVQAACGLAFGALGIRRIEAEVNPANQASARLLEALGFLREGLLRQRWQAKGRVYDTALYGCLAAEWHHALLPAPTTGQDHA